MPACLSVHVAQKGGGGGGGGGGVLLCGSIVVIVLISEFLNSKSLHLIANIQPTTNSF